MIASLKAYPEYKESGLEWASKIPGHWSKERGKRLFAKMERPVQAEDDVVTCFRDGTVTLRKKRRLSGFTEAIYEFGYQGIRKGDLVIHAMDAFAGAVGVSDSDGKGSPVYAVCQPKPSINAHYYAFIVREMARSQWILALSRGIRERSTDFRYDAFSRQYLPLPPSSEQEAIVRFLNWANGRLERAIRARRKIMALINEQKRAIIHRAVTGGDCSEWRTFPVHAVLRPVKRVGFPDKTLLSLFRDFGVVPKDSRENKNVDVRDLSLCQLVQPGDVVINKMKAWQGSVAVSELDGIVSPDYMVLQFTCDQFVPKFFHYLLRSPAMVAEYRRRAYGVRPGQWRLMYQEFRRICLPVPTLKEQSAIVETIDKAIKDVDRAATAVGREIDLLREYRTRLTADVVTGKLDVREAAARLPDEAAPYIEEEFSDLNDQLGISDEEITA